MFQVMPPLRTDEFAALKLDIAARGVLVPVEYDEQGTSSTAITACRPAPNLE